MIANIRAYFLHAPTLVAYMLQSTEYQVGPYLKWYWRTQNFAVVMHRRVLEPTRRARLLRDALRGGMLLQFAFGLAMVIVGARNPGYDDFIFFGLALMVSYPLVWAHLAVLPLLLAKWLVVEPANQRAIAESEKLFSEHPGAKIAVLGSYGKTTMKEMLAVILAEGKKVAATPANKNVAISHAQFARKLTGDEDVLVIEYGEGQPGDIGRFARTTHPTHAIITGLAPAHLDKYKTLDAAGQDIFSIKDFVPASHIFVNAESAEAQPYIHEDFHAYNQNGTNGWKVSNINSTPQGISFTLKKGSKKLNLKSGMLGWHQIGPLSAAVALGLELGLTEKQLERGITQTQPFPHRMQPYNLGGAWIIDDTYNGNLEGIRAGTALLGELKAARKWYVTPGLVDQGKETARVHEEVGRLIAAAKPDIVVLMRNSVTSAIQKGLQEAGFDRELRIEDDPLDFYTNLEHFVSHGDIVLMQNDWTDNYA